MNILKWNRKIKKIETEKNKIDFVYTYVDSLDQKWKKKWKKTFPNENINSVRYVNYDEIYFSLKTLEKYGKNICNNIYIFTDNQKLNDNKLSRWLLKKIKYVFHSDIIPKKFLPTFNSITIESFIHLIPKLTENFIYMNDDVFLGNELTNNFLYKNNILNILVFINNKKKYKYNKNKPWEHYYINADLLFKKKTGIISNINPTHTIYLMNKKVCYITWVMFKNELLNSITNKRESKNINFWYLTYLIGLYLGYYTYKVPNLKESYLMYCEKIGNKNTKKRLLTEVKTLFKNRPVIFCFNNITKLCSSIWKYIQLNYI
jgi:hypothetical protein